MLYNKDRALSLMQENGLKAIIATTHENVTYLTGHIGWAQRVYRQRKSCALLTKDSGTGTDLIMNRADNTYYAAYGGYAENVYSYGGQAYHIGQENYEPDNVEFEKYLELHNSGGENTTLLDGLVKTLKNRGISSGNIGLDEEGCSENLFAALEKEFPNCNFFAASGLFLMIRLVKTEEELKVLREAASINENAIQQVFNFIKEGVTENEVAEIWRQAVALPGAMWHWFHFNSGHRSVFIFPPTDKKLENGDLFMFDAGLFYKNYNADTGSCGCIGEPSDRIKKEWSAIKEGFLQSLEVVKAGCTGGQIYKALLSGIKSKFPEFDAPFAGHTIGLEAREFPFILGEETKHNQKFLPSTSEIPLPANSVINIEAPIGTFGFGGYQIEYSVIVKENGWEPLIEQKRDLKIIE